MHMQFFKMGSWHFASFRRWHDRNVECRSALPGRQRQCTTGVCCSHPCFGSRHPTLIGEMKRSVHESVNSCYRCRVKHRAAPPGDE
ncbi:hypothetical protein BU25DRAFT_111258 [Macroventuria anomochaeta]|uniref:Uncharacterized protein n=1 Tax=Macroventuria anomochaeta TaxID=301207 RepID=A0ACB6RVR2_9PLEO|nr:uncharacterized protein BU25DRAFT_111258 [Macroventuria anomochaeta]KAF2625787.1 hypothetical protein BU25DRAFT_111258 [Macroventuria anomochaeta]